MILAALLATARETNRPNPSVFGARYVRMNCNKASSFYYSDGFDQNHSNLLIISKLLIPLTAPDCERSGCVRILDSQLHLKAAPLALPASPCCLLAPLVFTCAAFLPTATLFSAAGGNSLALPSFVEKPLNRAGRSGRR